MSSLGQMFSESSKEKILSLEEELARYKDLNRSMSDYLVEAAKLAALVPGKKIDAIKFYRAARGQGLRDSKDWVENYIESQRPWSTPESGSAPDLVSRVQELERKVEILMKDKP